MVDLGFSTLHGFRHSLGGSEELETYPLWKRWGGLLYSVQQPVMVEDVTRP